MKRQQQLTDRLSDSDNDLSTLAYNESLGARRKLLHRRKSVREMIQAIEEKIKRDRESRRRIETTNPRAGTMMGNESDHRPKKKMRVLPIDLKDRPRLIFLLPHQHSESSIRSI